MQVVVEIPDSVASRLKDENDPSRALLEAYAAEGYRLRQLSRGQVTELLGFGFYEGEEWFRQRGLSLNYGVEEFEKDLQNVESFIARK